MKGTMFQRPLELNLEAYGETWEQGQAIKGSLRIKNHSQDEIKIDSLNVKLAYGVLRKVKAKDQKAFKILSDFVCAEKFSIGAGQEESYDWEFKLDINAPITDTIGSLYIIYGANEDLLSCGFLQLNIELKKILNEYLQIFENFFRYKIGPKKYKKGVSEVKMIPPKSKKMGAVDSLLCQMKIENENLHVKYIFKTNKLNASQGSVKILKVQKEFEHTLTPKQYLFFGGSPNQDVIKEEIGEILKKVVPKLIS